MSEPLRIALVAEGPTDRVVISAALRVILSHRAFVLTQLQPESSIVFKETGTGWVGVYRWCKQAAKRGFGRLAQDALLFQNYDLLILHVDADVADMSYADGSIAQQPSDAPLPCACPCPPASATTNALRSAVLSWGGDVAIPPRTVICMPSKSTEAWVVAALFPGDQSIQQGIECFANPESRLGQQPKKHRIRKKQRDYEDRSAELSKAWPRLVEDGLLGEARRFQREFLEQIAIVCGRPQ